MKAEPQKPVAPQWRDEKTHIDPVETACKSHATVEP
jgi:hypothetical protein